MSASGSGSSGGAVPFSSRDRAACVASVGDLVIPHF
jgi:hypothetical protein